MKLGCCISYHHLEEAKRFGYDFAELSAVEIMSVSEADWSAVCEHIRSIGLPIIGFNSFSDDRIALVGPHQDPKKNESYLQAVLHRAIDLDCRNIGIGAPKTRQLPADFSYAKATEQMQQFLTMAAQTAAPHHISILYEALHPYTCNFGNHTAEICDTVHTLQLANLHMVWDVYHAFLSGEDFTPAISCMKEIRHVHVCGWDEARNRYYLSETDAPLIHDLFAFLTEHGYDGTISIEASDKDFSTTGERSLHLLRTAQSEAKK